MFRAWDDYDPATYPEDPAEWPDILVVAGTIFGEARGESLQVKLAVGLVIRNRVQSPVTWWGNSWKKVCLKKWQFSCWLKQDPNREKILEPMSYEAAAVWFDCLLIARLVMDPAFIQNDFGGATHYYDISLDQPGRKAPKWAADLEFKAQEGRLKFYA